MKISAGVFAISVMTIAVAVCAFYIMLILTGGRPPLPQGGGDVGAGPFVIGCVVGFLVARVANQLLTFRMLLVGVLIILITLLATGCSFLPTRTVVKTETVEVPKYQRAPLPAKLVQPCTYVEPDPLCWRVDHREFCDEQLLEIRLGYRNVLQNCNDDKTELRTLGPVADDG